MEMKVITSQEIFGKKFDIYGSVEDPLFLAKDIADWIDYNKFKKIQDDIKSGNLVG